MNDKESFGKAKTWLTKLRKELDSELPIALAANKCDDDQGTFEVDLEEADAFAREHGMKLFRTSAKTGRNVFEMFEWLAQNLPAAPIPTNEGVQVTSPPSRGNRTVDEGCC